MSQNPEPLAQFVGWVQIAALLAFGGSMIWQSVKPPITHQSGLLEAVRRADADPLNTETLRSVGLALSLQGKNEDADAVLSFTGRRTWRDGPTSAWLLGQRLVQGRITEAVDQADALLRVDGDGQLRPTLFPLLMAVDASDFGRAPLIEHLSRAPWWREAFVQALAAHGDLKAAGDTLVALRHGPSPAQDDEISPYFERLVFAGDYALAQARWNQVAGPRCCDGPFIRDRRFASLNGHNPMTWSAPLGAGVSVQSQSGGLRVDYDGVSNPQITRQLIFLAPGPWRLTGGQQWQGEDRRQSLVWTLRCAEDGRSLVRGAQYNLAGAWTPFSSDVVVPAEGCTAQWLQLEPMPGERVSPVTAWFRDLAVVRGRAEPTAPFGP